MPVLASQEFNKPNVSAGCAAVSLFFQMGIHLYASLTTGTHQGTKLMLPSINGTVNNTAFDIAEHLVYHIARRLVMICPDGTSKLDVR